MGRELELGHSNGGSLTVSAIDALVVRREQPCQMLINLKRVGRVHQPPREMSRGRMSDPCLLSLPHLDRLSEWCFPEIRAREHILNIAQCRGAPVVKALVLRNGFGLENLTRVEMPDPVPGPGQVLVRVRAASLNYRDLLIVKGHYNPKLKFPRVLGSDAAGEVVAVGSEVRSVKVGDRVIGSFMQHWIDGPISDSAARSTLGSDRDGVLAEMALFEESGFVPVPGDLTFAEAATLPCAGVTAWNALTGGGCGPGKTVLVQGTGGVSIFALQFARALGARVLITSSRDDKLARALSLGANAGVNYKTVPEWDKWVREQTDGAGADIVVEVGGAGTLERSAKAVRSGGYIALIGVLAGGTSFNPIFLLMKAICLQGIFVGSKAMFVDMNRFIVGEHIRPVIDRVFPFVDAAAALRHLESGSHFGKVVVEM
jgi:NADPH:quinone reductase-like Zn-dependent oxidoreductase